ncbi:MAG: VOC family protein [Acidobacteriota bacterium]
MLSHRHIFHLSIPVADLERAGAFYCEVLGATIGRAADEWLDVLLWGHQITLQERPSEVLPPEAQGKRHFGVVLPWPEWERLADRLRAAGVSFLEEPSVTLRGTPREQAKFYLADPSNNVIEIKAYRDVTAVLGYPKE